MSQISSNPIPPPRDRPITVGLVQIAQVNWSHRKRERFTVRDGIIVDQGGAWSDAAPSFSYIPYAVGSLQAFVQAHAADPSRYRWLLPVYRRLPIGELVATLADADVVGFSSYVWNVEQNLAAARELKRLRPDRLIVFGGPQVPARAEAFLRRHPFIDVVCHGEAERVLLQVLEAYETGDWSQVGSISRLTPDGAFATARSLGRAKDLSDFPSPYLSGVFDPLMRAHPGQGWMAMWETNRGCPYSCTYCDWGSAVASKVHRFDMDRLKAEMDWFARNKIRFLFICDANFGILPRDIEIARYLVDTYERHGSFVNISIQNAKNQVERTYQIQRILTESKVATFGATIAMQGVAEQTLKAIKRDNISIASFNELQRRFKRDGLDTYTDIIVGLPGETYESFADGVDLIIANGQHNRMTSYNCSVLINAEMGDPDYIARFGIESVSLRIIYQHDDIAVSEGEDVHEFIDTIIATRSLDRADWRRARVYAWLVELLHFNRLLQIAFVTLNRSYGFSFREMVEAFVEAEPERYPVLSDMVAVLTRQAERIQAGESEFIASPDYLGIWWPADQFALLRLVARRSLPAFYAEAEALLGAFIAARRPRDDLSLLRDALRVNAAAFRVPECFEDAEVVTEHNILEVYWGVLAGEDVLQTRGRHRYHVDRTSLVWLSFDAWATDVVLQVYQRGQYLYPLSALPPPASEVGTAARDARAAIREPA